MVVAIIMVLAGAVAIPLLPIGEFPDIAPPTIQVSATYTGGSANVVEDSVTTPLEEQINGVEGMIYMSSNSSDDGSSNITVTFETGYDLDTAAIDVQNRVQIAQSQLPAEVIRQGVAVTKQSNELTLGVNLISRDSRFDQLFISNYADIHVADTLKRIPGVGSITIWGERKYAMRIWLDPYKLGNLGIAAAEVVEAIAQQNQQVPAGALGQPPMPDGQKFQYTLTALGRLSEPEQFREIVVRAGGDGALVRLKDVARVELGAESYSALANLDGIPSIPIGVFQLPGANALKLAADVRAAMDHLAQRFPQGLEYEIVYDTTDFVRESIRELLITLAQAIGLVFAVILLFLRNWRATLIPAITIPVCLVGTAALMLMLGFTVNTLTLFGLVLAVGLVVDDAIVVVENVDRHLEGGKLGPTEAARFAMGQVTSPIVATSLVLMAVFIPVAFIPGVTGQLYQQFALTIACAVGISAFNALTLSPALCALLLRPGRKQAGGFGGKFEAIFARFTEFYAGAVQQLVKRWYLVLMVFIALLFGTYKMFEVVPSGFIPDEDQGYFIIGISAPEGTALNRTGKITDQVDAILRDTPGIGHAMSFTGFSFISNTGASNVGTVFPILTHWQERTTPETQIDAIIASVQARFDEIPGAYIISINPPVVSGLSATGGFDLELQDYAGGSLQALAQLSHELIAKALARPEIGTAFGTFSADTPQYFIEIDRTKAIAEGVNLDALFNTLQVYLGGYYVNDFNKFGRVYQVYVQSEGATRADPQDIGRLHVRNANGGMVPLSTLVRLEPRVGARTITHYNLFRSASINGGAAPGYSSGEAIKAMEQVAGETLPQSMGYQWTGNAYQELEAGNLAPLIFGLSLVCVFLFLAAQYESWAMPFMVVLAVPLAMFGALSGQWIRGLENDIYCQVGLVMLIGLASKNAILIVEFARRRHKEGLSIEMAAVEAARVRLRPILMTAFAFILGVLPLLFASGAGANARHSLGTAVFGGMIAATFLSLMLVPVLYVVIERLRERRAPPSTAQRTPPAG